MRTYVVRLSRRGDSGPGSHGVIEVFENFVAGRREREHTAALRLDTRVLALYSEVSKRF